MFLDGDTAPILERLEVQMREAADSLEFELAARLRDRAASVRKAIEKQQMVSERAEDLDCFALAEDELEAAVQVFYVRRGRVVGRKGFIVDKVEDLEPPQLLAHILEQHYSDAINGVPPLVLVPGEVDEKDVLEEWLWTLRAEAEAEARPRPAVRPRPGATAVGRRRGSGGRPAVSAGPSAASNPRPAGVGRPRLHVPQRGEKKALLEMVAKNAAEELVRHRLKRSSDHNARARALNALQDALDLPEAPLRIECYDMSHLQGTDYVGSMVVMEDGLPKPAEYRRFKVRTVAGNDDYAAMEEVLTRRLTAYLTERELPVAERKRHFSYPPQLLLVDGGKGQLNVAVRVLEELGPGGGDPGGGIGQAVRGGLPARAWPSPVRVPRGSEALYLLQRVRDEAHRFAISYHRQLRAKRMTASVLDGVPGLGPARQEAPAGRAGGHQGRPPGPAEAFESLSWLPEPVVEALWEKIHGGRSAPERPAPARRRHGPSRERPRGRARMSAPAPRWPRAGLPQLERPAAARGRRPLGGQSGWWQESFTEGADPEYTEQIVPLLREHLEQVAPGAVLDVGCGEGQLSRVAAGLPGVGQVVGVDPTVGPAPGGARARRQRRPAPAGRSSVRRGRPPAACPFPTPASTPPFACLVFEHIEGTVGALAEVGRVLRPGGTFLLFLNHPLLQAPGSGWVDDHILGEQYWRIGPYLVEHHGVEEVDKNVWIPFVHRPLSVYVNGLAAAGLLLDGDGGAGAAGRVSWSGRRSTGRRRPSPGCSCCGPRSWPRRAWTPWAGPDRGADEGDEDVAEFVIITGLSGAGRSQAGAALEDLGWYVMDNMPTALITKVADLVSTGGPEAQRLALVVGRHAGQLGELADGRPAAAGSGRTGVACCSSMPPTRCWCAGSRAPAGATRWARRASSRR